MAITCRQCTEQRVALDSGLLTIEDADVVVEHLDSCPRCIVFNSQLDRTAEVLEALPLPEPPPAAVEALCAHTADDRDISSSLKLLCRLADSLSPGDAEDLVQQTLLEAFEHDSVTLDVPDLARRLTDRVVGLEEPRTVSSFEEISFDGDADSDTSELFYPEFYEEGPDAGRFVAMPNTWGLVQILAPDEDVEMGELFDVVESALADLPAPERQLVELVDVAGVPMGEAAAALRLGAYDAAVPLLRGRVHVRGALDTYLTATRGG